MSLLEQAPARSFEPVAKQGQVAFAEKTAPRWMEVVSHLDPRYGGLSAAVPRLGASLAAGLGADPIAISLAAFCAPGEHVAPEGFSPDKTTYWPASRAQWVRDRWQGAPLRKSFFQQVQQTDGLHIHGLWEGSTALAAAAARRFRKPYLLSAHGMLEPWALAKKKLKKQLYGVLVERATVADAACLHALTQTEARQFIDFGARSPIAVIPNAVDRPANTTSATFLEHFPSLKGKRLLLFLARLHPKKGLEILLDAWASLVSVHPDFQLVLAGPDSEGTQARLQQHIKDHGLEASVTFTGMLHGALKWSALAAAELFVLPSFSEGLSVSVLEAMAMGKPVVITTACNLPEVAMHDAGWIVEPNAAALRGVLSEVLRSTPATNQGVGGRGVRLVEERFAWPVVARQMAEVYAWTLGGRRPEGVDLVFPA